MHIWTPRVIEDSDVVIPGCVQFNKLGIVDDRFRQTCEHGVTDGTTDATRWERDYVIHGCTGNSKQKNVSYHANSGLFTERTRCGQSTLASDFALCDALEQACMLLCCAAEQPGLTLAAWLAAACTSHLLAFA